MKAELEQARKAVIDRLEEFYDDNYDDYTRDDYDTDDSGYVEYNYAEQQELFDAVLEQKINGIDMKELIRENIAEDMEKFELTPDKESIDKLMDSLLPENSEDGRPKIFARFGIATLEDGSKQAFVFSEEMYHGDVNEDYQPVDLNTLEIMNIPDRNTRDMFYDATHKLDHDNFDKFIEDNAPQKDTPEIDNEDREL